VSTSDALRGNIKVKLVVEDLPQPPTVSAEKSLMPSH